MYYFEGFLSSFGMCMRVYACCYGNTINGMMHAFMIKISFIFFVPQTSLFGCFTIFAEVAAAATDAANVTGCQKRC